MMHLASNVHFSTEIGKGYEVKPSGPVRLHCKKLPQLLSRFYFLTKSTSFGRVDLSVVDRCSLADLHISTEIKNGLPNKSELNLSQYEP